MLELGEREGRLAWVMSGAPAKVGRDEIKMRPHVGGGQGRVLSVKTVYLCGDASSERC